MNKIAYVENGIGYIFEDQLPNCECGITTGICDTAERAISIWFKAFGNILKQNDDYDVCLGCSANFNKEEYY